MDEQIKRVFNQIDFNKSGAIELDEFSLLFAQQGINMSRHDLIQLFNIVDKDCSGDVSIKEFRDFAHDSKSNELFKSLIQQAR